MKHTLSTLIATIAIILGSAVPSVALAYLSPEQVFGDGLTAAAAGPSTRGGAEAVKRQQENSVSGQYQEAQKLASSSEAQHAAADDVVQTEQPNQSLGLFDDSVQYEKRMVRMNESNRQGEVLHSGAPLVTNTGPASVLGVLVLILAGASTLGYSAWKSRRMAA